MPTIYLRKHVYQRLKKLRENVEDELRRQHGFKSNVPYSQLIEDLLNLASEQWND